MSKPYSEILLRLKQKFLPTNLALITSAETTAEQAAIVATACKKIETDCGYLISPELFALFCHITPSEFPTFFKTLYGQLQAYKGVVSTKPFHVNFPQQVMQTQEVELYQQAVATPEAADTVFSPNEGFDPSDTAALVSSFITGETHRTSSN